MHLKYSWNWKKPKNSLFCGKSIKKPKNQKKTKKTKKNTGMGFLYKKTGFFQPCHKVNLSIGEKGLPVLEMAKRSRDQDNDDEEGESSSVEQVNATKNDQFEREHFELDNMTLSFLNFRIAWRFDFFGGKIAILKFQSFFLLFSIC